jgi:hypothetical protein
MPRKEAEVQPENRTTGPGVPGSAGRHERPVKWTQFPEWEMTRSRLVRAVIELMREHRQLTHVPTRAQVCAMAGLEGRAPSTYRLDPAVNWLPRCRPADFPLGTDGLRFTHTNAIGDSVVLPNGCAFRLDWLD